MERKPQQVLDPHYGKQVHECTRDFEEDVKKFTENPDAADDEDEKEMSKDQVIFFQITRNGILLPKLFCEKKLF